MAQQTFKRWKPGVWAALNTGLCRLEEEEEDERGQAIQIQKGIPSSSLEEQHLVSHAGVGFDMDNIIAYNMGRAYPSCLSMR